MDTQTQEQKNEGTSGVPHRSDRAEDYVLDSTAEMSTPLGQSAYSGSDATQITQQETSLMKTKMSGNTVSSLMVVLKEPTQAVEHLEKFLVISKPAKIIRKSDSTRPVEAASYHVEQKISMGRFYQSTVATDFQESSRLSESDPDPLPATEHVEKSVVLNRNLTIVITLNYSNDRPSSDRHQPSSRRGSEKEYKPVAKDASYHGEVFGTSRTDTSPCQMIDMLESALNETSREMLASARTDREAFSPHSLHSDRTSFSHETSEDLYESSREPEQNLSDGETHRPEVNTSRLSCETERSEQYIKGDLNDDISLTNSNPAADDTPAEVYDMILRMGMGHSQTPDRTGEVELKHSLEDDEDLYEKSRKPEQNPSEVETHRQEVNISRLSCETERSEEYIQGDLNDDISLINCNPAADDTTAEVYDMILRMGMRHSQTPDRTGEVELKSPLEDESFMFTAERMKEETRTETVFSDVQYSGQSFRSSRTTVTENTESKDSSCFTSTASGRYPSDSDQYLMLESALRETSQELLAAAGLSQAKESPAVQMGETMEPHLSQHDENLHEQVVEHKRGSECRVSCETERAEEFITGDVDDSISFIKKNSTADTAIAGVFDVILRMGLEEHRTQFLQDDHKHPDDGQSCDTVGPAEKEDSAAAPCESPRKTEPPPPPPLPPPLPPTRVLPARSAKKRLHSESPIRHSYTDMTEIEQAVARAVQGPSKERRRQRSSSRGSRQRKQLLDIQEKDNEKDQNTSQADHGTPLQTKPEVADGLPLHPEEAVTSEVRQKASVNESCAVVDGKHPVDASVSETDRGRASSDQGPHTSPSEHKHIQKAEIETVVEVETVLEYESVLDSREAESYRRFSKENTPVDEDPVPASRIAFPSTITGTMPHTAAEDLDINAIEANGQLSDRLHCPRPDVTDGSIFQVRQHQVQTTLAPEEETSSDRHTAYERLSETVSDAQPDVDRSVSLVTEDAMLSQEGVVLARHIPRDDAMSSERVSEEEGAATGDDGGYFCVTKVYVDEEEEHRSAFQPYPRHTTE